ncbi:histidine kinase dimerization/phospho-acceptor domain-containing protein [Novosphingobium bradum]|uniref:histidine kinase n=1 Tax=Novosphingobium bradum TaxID=1737444 RepID=A0ABV7IT31_9SPHN
MGGSGHGIGWKVMVGMETDESRKKLSHDARQPLNAIRLVTANLQARLSGALDPELAAWTAAKLEKIDRQVDRLAELLGRLD